MKKVLFGVGCVLLLLNLYGLSRSLRSESLSRNVGADELSLSYDEFKKQAVRKPEETGSQYIQRVTVVVERGMAYVWGDDAKDYNLRVPIWENYLLFGASYLRPDIFSWYQFVDADKAMERGIGICSEQSVVLAQLLRRNNIAATLQALDGHIVVRARDEKGKIYIADPTYGVVFPYSIHSIERHPDIVRGYYGKTGLPKDEIDRLVRVYGPQGNRSLSIKDYFEYKTFYAEAIAYKLKWILPLLLMLPLMLMRQFGVAQKLRAGVVSARHPLRAPAHGRR